MSPPSCCCCARMPESMLPTYSAPIAFGSSPESARASFTAAAPRYRPRPCESLVTAVWPMPAMNTSLKQSSGTPSDGAHHGKGSPRMPTARHGAAGPSAIMRIERERSAPLSAKVAIVVVGFGNMGQALVRGWLAKGRAASSIRVVDPVVATHAVAQDLKVAVADSVAAADVVLLAVKPSQLGDVLPRCGAAVRAGAVFLSIVAGKTLAEIG